MRLLIAGGIALLAWGSEPAAAATMAEIGDAGDLPGTAQTSAGVQSFGTPLDSISGTIAFDSDQDVFEIFINDPANFSASTNNSGTNLTDDDDTMLFLFDASGFGILGTDDIDKTNLKSTIPAGSLTGLSGIYFIAVSTFFNTPISSGGAIFDLKDLRGAAGDAVGPNGPGGGSPITGWNLELDPPQTGPYRIDLTGATFVSAPEPSSAALTALGLVGLAGLARGRRLHPSAAPSPRTSAPRTRVG